MALDDPSISRASAQNPMITTDPSAIVVPLTAVAKFFPPDIKPKKRKLDIDTIYQNSKRQRGSSTAAREIYSPDFRSTIRLPAGFNVKRHTAKRQPRPSSNDMALRPAAPGTNQISRKRASGSSTAVATRDPDAQAHDMALRRHLYDDRVYKKRTRERSNKLCNKQCWSRLQGIPENVDILQRLEDGMLCLSDSVAVVDDRETKGCISVHQEFQYPVFGWAAADGLRRGIEDYLVGLGLPVRKADDPSSAPPLAHPSLFDEFRLLVAAHRDFRAKTSTTSDQLVRKMDAVIGSVSPNYAIHVREILENLEAMWRFAYRYYRHFPFVSLCVKASCVLLSLYFVPTKHALDYVAIKGWTMYLARKKSTSLIFAQSPDSVDVGIRLTGYLYGTLWRIAERCQGSDTLTMIATTNLKALIDSLQTS